jgi:hypothetical protein
MKFTWYKPANPGVRPEKIGCARGHATGIEQLEGAVFGR